MGMKWNKKLLILLMMTGSMLFLTACSAQGDGKDGFFQTLLVNPIIKIIHGIAEFFNGNYGLAIIGITLLIRLILMPLMLKQYKNQQEMKVKMDILKPEMEVIQKKLKETKDPAEQQKLQMEMMGLYKKHNVNPLNMGCLPILIQMPILMGLYYAIRSSADIASHSFLWFSLGESDIWITALAGIVYYLQFKVSMSNVPAAQQQQMKIMGLMSPIMIVFVSINAPAALPLYWTVGGLFLTIQTLIGRRMYQTNPKTKTEEA
jgi:YidC/Oxa1 family membrane protein insertase